MKKKVLTLLLAGVLGSMMVSSGVVTALAAEAEVKEETSELKTIGAKEKEEGAFGVKLVNETGKDIKDVKIKVSGHSEFADVENLLEKDDVFAADEERMLNYLPKLKEEKAEDKEKKEEPETLVFDVQLTFADDTTAVVHTFPFGDIEEGQLCVDGEIAYLIFESVSLKEEVNTLETEKKIAETIKAQKEAAEAAAKAAANAAANASSNDYYDYSSESYDDSYDYSEDDAGEDTSGETGDQCLNGGLLN